MLWREDVIRSQLPGETSRDRDLSIIEWYGHHRLDAEIPEETSQSGSDLPFPIEGEQSLTERSNLSISSSKSYPKVTEKLNLPLHPHAYRTSLWIADIGYIECYNRHQSIQLVAAIVFW